MQALASLGELRELIAPPQQQQRLSSLRRDDLAASSEAHSIDVTVRARMSARSKWTSCPSDGSTHQHQLAHRSIRQPLTVASQGVCMTPWRGGGKRIEPLQVRLGWQSG